MRGRLSLRLNRGCIPHGLPRISCREVSGFHVRRETLVAFLSSQQRSRRAERRARSCSAATCLVIDTELAWIVCVIATRMKTHIFKIRHQPKDHDLRSK